MPRAEVICQSSSPQINATTLPIVGEGDGWTGAEQYTRPGLTSSPHTDTHQGFCETSHGTLIVPQGDWKELWYLQGPGKAITNLKQAAMVVKNPPIQETQKTWV